jgi:hypothetical protein
MPKRTVERSALHRVGLKKDDLSHFAEAPSLQPITDEYRSRVFGLLPTSWALKRDGVWIHAHPGSDTDAAPTRTQGFKIHVSSTPSCASAVLDLVVPVVVDQDVPFKVIGDPSLHDWLNSKHQPRGYSGKFMTIYPSDDSAFADLMERLYQHSREVDVNGPRILSDRQYKDSRILYYRYGGFHPPRRVKIDGTHATYLVSPTGQLVADERVPYFQLPAWVDDPFGVKAFDVDEASILLGDRYLVNEALGFSNCGGLYRATDNVTAQTVFIKEARPQTNCWGSGATCRDAAFFLRREFEMLRYLHELDFVPNALALLEESDHVFLVEQHLAAVTMRKFWARSEVILSPYIRWPGRIDQWTEIFDVVASQLISMIDVVHKKGVLLGDMSPDNIMIEPDSWRMWLVDLDSAVLVDADVDTHRRAAMWITPGFGSPERSRRHALVPADDYYAAGMVLFYGLNAITPLFEIDRTAIDRFLDGFSALGLPGKVAATIRHLLAGDAESALKALQE